LIAAAARSSVEATLVLAPPLAVLFWLSGAVSLATALAAMAMPAGADVNCPIVSIAP